MSSYSSAANKSKLTKNGDYNSSNYKQSSNAATNKSSAIISTAFQDHIVKQLNLNSMLSPSGATSSSLYHRASNQPAKAKSAIKSKVDTGLKKDHLAKKNSTFQDTEKEFVLPDKDKLNASLTLAEKIGIVPSDPSKQNLDENDWSKVKEQYIKREDFKEPCVICKEALGTQQQVLLSCSHTFHRKCLQAFEKFSGKKCCPMCRKDRYQTRVVHDASKHYRHLCASKIQAAWRGYLVKRWYNNYRKTVPPQNEMLRKKFFQEKLTDITNRIVQSFNYEIDNLLIDCDRNIYQSRETFKYFEEKCRAISEDQWEELMQKNIQRSTDECSICMNRCELPKKYSRAPCFITSPRNTGAVAYKPLVLLSCSHLYHEMCLETFEELNFDKLPVCPVCRSAYKKNKYPEY